MERAVEEGGVVKQQHSAVMPSSSNTGQAKPPCCCGLASTTLTLEFRGVGRMRRLLGRRLAARSCRRPRNKQRRVVPRTEWLQGFPPSFRGRLTACIPNTLYQICISSGAHPQRCLLRTDMGSMAPSQPGSALSSAALLLKGAYLGGLGSLVSTLLQLIKRR